MKKVQNIMCPIIIMNLWYASSCSVHQQFMYFQCHVQWHFRSMSKSWSFIQESTVISLPALTKPFSCMKKTQKNTIPRADKYHSYLLQTTWIKRKREQRLWTTPAQICIMDVNKVTRMDQFHISYTTEEWNNRLTESNTKCSVSGEYLPPSDTRM